MEGLTFIFSDANQSKFKTAPSIGGTGGTLNIFSLEKGDKITSIDIFYESQINGLRINTRSGKSWICGKPSVAYKN